MDLLKSKRAAQRGFLPLCRPPVFVFINASRQADTVLYLFPNRPPSLLPNWSKLILALIPSTS